MNKSSIQKFAVWARTELIAQVSQRAYQYGITEEGYGEADAVVVSGRALTPDEERQRRELVSEIRMKGYHQVMEEVAYTWFNRFIALRFMEVNNYLPSHVRVFSDSTGAFKPEILSDVLHLDLPGLDQSKVADLIEKNQTESLYRYLLLTQCNALNECLPVMFEKMGGYTELLLPNNILRQDGIIGRLVSDIEEDDWKNQVQIIGWLYQYYNSELKDETFALLKKNVKVTKERIPSATQLFTPDWIVRYMVENSLGRLYIQWAEGSGQWTVSSEQLAEGSEQWAEREKEIAEKFGWKYYIPEAIQTPEVCQQLTNSHSSLTSVKDIRIIDPCMGSGHILVYAFDVLMQIYLSQGYSERDAVCSILKNNLYGLDIDKRAAQLAYFAVMMKARQYDRRIFSRGITPNVFAITESNGLSQDAIYEFVKGDPKLKHDLDSIISDLHDAKEYGSILTISPVDFDRLYARLDELMGGFTLYYQDYQTHLLPLLKTAELLSMKYDVVVTNPPYMGASNMNAKLSDFVKANYADYKSDFFSVFIVRCMEMAKPSGYLGFFTPYVWMFIQSYEKLRHLLYTQATIETLIQYEYSAFEEATVPVCSFAFKKGNVAGKKGCYLRLTDFRGGMEVQRQKALEAINNHDCGFYFEQTTDNFSKIPGSPVAYWASEAMFSAFANGTPLAEIAPTRKGMFTGDNDLWLKFWFEINYRDFRGTFKPYNKGGEFRRWYGNNDYVVNWRNNGADIMAFKGSGNINPSLYFRKCITWSLITSYKTSFRIITDTDHVMGDAGPVAIADDSNIYYLLALLNSKPVEAFIEYIAPTINFSNGAAGDIPVFEDSERKEKVEELSKMNVNISKEDWDSFELSWDFKRHPLI